MQERSEPIQSETTAMMSIDVIRFKGNAAENGVSRPATNGQLPLGFGKTILLACSPQKTPSSDERCSKCQAFLKSVNPITQKCHSLHSGGLLHFACVELPHAH